MYRDSLSGKRRLKSTGCKKGAQADPYIREFVDALAKPAAPQTTFAEYACPYFLWESCPRVRRRLAEGKQIGRTHCRMSRALLDRWVVPGTAFSSRPLAEIRRPLGRSGCPRGRRPTRAPSSVTSSGESPEAEIPGGQDPDPRAGAVHAFAAVPSGGRGQED